MNYRFLSFILLCLWFSSCGMYKYKYNSSNNSIESVKGNDITGVDVSDDQGNHLASFSRWEGHNSSSFCLTDFSSKTYFCNSDIPFKLDSGKIYVFEVFPKGDRMIQPLKLVVGPNGRITPFKPNKRDLSGKYEYSRQEIKNAAAYSTITLIINKDKTFHYESSSHIFHGASEDNGTWITSGDTLILKQRLDKASATEIFGKYLIAGKKLCDISDGDTKDLLCLTKKE